MLKRISVIFIVILVITVLPNFSIKTKENSNKSRFVKDHFILKLKPMNPGAASFGQKMNPVEEIKEISKKLNLNVKSVKALFPPSIFNISLYEKYEMGCYYIVSTADKVDVPDICSKYEKLSEVDFAEPDFIGEAAGKSSAFSKPSVKPNDEFFDRQWGLNNDGSVRTTTGKNGLTGADMNVLQAWDIDKGSENTVVAILDSGVKLDHPELAGRIWNNPKETKNGRDDDGNGFVDDITGWNFAYDNSNVKDDGGHGSNISGTIGANTDNSIGYAGLDQRCKLMPCKNLDEENLGEYSWWAASLYYAANNGAKVINMSEGGYDYSKTLANAINFAYDAGALIVASMMNKNNGDTYYPASLPNVMAVGATDTDDSRCREFTWGGGSNWGKHISVIAPGNRIYGLDYKDNSNWEVYWSGTSQATAYVSGIASVLISQNPSRTNKDLKQIITSTAKDQVGDPREDTPGWDEYYGYGRVDMYTALNYDNPNFDNKGNKLKEDMNKKDDNDYNKKKDDSDEGESKKAKADDPSNHNSKEDDHRAHRHDR